MVYLICIFKVEAYKKFKQVYDENISLFKAKGSKSSRILRSLKDPNLIVTIMEFDNMEKAENFAKSEEIQATNELSGIIGEGDVYFVEEIENLTL